ncbi:hypothetical protein ACLOJK_024277, partial [Asimina triloba]
PNPATLPLESIAEVPLRHSTRPSIPPERYGFQQPSVSHSTALTTPKGIVELLVYVDDIVITTRKKGRHLSANLAMKQCRAAILPAKRHDRVAVCALMCDKQGLFFINPRHLDFMESGEGIEKAYKAMTYSEINKLINIREKITIL